MSKLRANESALHVVLEAEAPCIKPAAPLPGATPWRAGRRAALQRPCLPHASCQTPRLRTASTPPQRHALRAGCLAARCVRAAGAASKPLYAPSRCAHQQPLLANRGGAAVTSACVAAPARLLRKSALILSALSPHLYTETSIRPVEMATSTRKKGKRMAAMPMMASGSCGGG